ncbi:Dephospho-CoA kinase [Nitrosomonas sp. Is79A3]|uniref:dephospho-CoA kinase n=1 Tax=Nitrosomonas sp. (strain Is79A3) TaxID=261292 RepID=UPI000215CEA0
MTFIVGLTGGIGCGKSSASQFFLDLGIDVVDTDVIARNLTQPHGLAINPIRNAFQDSMIAADGSLDREKMRNLIFSDNDSRFKLENILHPLILKETIQKIAQTKSSYIIIVVPLLFETNDYDNIIQRILIVDCEEQQQISRTISRSNLSEQQVRAIMATQISRKERLQKADDVMINNQDIDYLKAQVIQLHHKYLNLAESKRDARI